MRAKQIKRLRKKISGRTYYAGRIMYYANRIDNLNYDSEYVATPITDDIHDVRKRGEIESFYVKKFNAKEIKRIERKLAFLKRKVGLE
jgi:hypothetical protein